MAEDYSSASLLKPRFNSARFRWTRNLTQPSPASCSPFAPTPLLHSSRRTSHKAGTRAICPIEERYAGHLDEGCRIIGFISCKSVLTLLLSLPIAQCDGANVGNRLLVAKETNADLHSRVSTNFALASPRFPLSLLLGTNDSLPCASSQQIRPSS